MSDKLQKVGEKAKQQIYKKYLQRIAKGEKLNASEVKVFKELELEFSGKKADRLYGTQDVIDYAAKKGLGLTTRQVKYNTGKRLPVQQDGSYLKVDVDEFITWKLTEGQRYQTDNEEVLDWRAIKEKYSALIEKEKFEKISGSVVAKKEVDRMLRERAYEFRMGCYAISRAIAHQILSLTHPDINDIVEIIDKMHDEMLDNYSRGHHFTLCEIEPLNWKDLVYDVLKKERNGGG